MKVIIVLCSLWAITFAVDNGVCYNTFVSYCYPPDGSTADDTILKSCNASYGGAEFVMGDLAKFANAHISVSFDYLLLATNFGSFEKDRKGFEKLFRHLSDSTWEDGIDLIKFISKRGGNMDLHMMRNNTAHVQKIFLLNEIQGLARALDTHRNLAAMAYSLHEKASAKENHEPEVAAFLEDKFLHKQADIIRSLAGHISDVMRMISYPEQKSVSLFIFDEYLKSH